MKLLVYGINYSPELTGIGNYTGDMAPRLSAQGHSVKVITAPPYYPDWQIHEGFPRYWFQRVNEHGVSITRCPLFVPGNPTTLKRLLHLGSFAFSSFFALFAHWRWRPDIVVLVVPSLFCAVNALLYTRITGGKCLIHVQDFEVDALFGLSGNNVFLRRCAQKLESSLLCRFDKVSTISTGMLRRAIDKGVEPSKLLLFPNWSEISRFQGLERDEYLLNLLGVPAGKKVILYSGNLGDKQGLEIIVDAAKLLQAEKHLHFLVVGEGAGKARMQDLVTSLHLDNLTFAPLQPKAQLPALLASADCHLVVQKRGAADAVLPSKLTNILAVGGNAVITADPDTTLGILCSDFPGIAVCVDPESPGHLVQGIQKALAMSSPNPVAQDYAQRFLDKAEILTKFERDLLALVQDK